LRLKRGKKSRETIMKLVLKRLI